MFKDVLVISAVNLVEGGTLTILNNCLSFLNSNSFICNNYRVIALVHNKNTFHFENIESLQTVDEIDFFLEIADYVYQFSRYNKELFNQYRNYVNEQYNEFIL